MTTDLSAMNARAVAELSHVIDGIDPTEIDAFIDAVAAAKRIACHGVGREGLMIKALCMRLFHLGLDAHVVGDMTTPPLGPGDLLVVSAGPGGFATVSAFIDVAKQAGARVVCFTAAPDGASAAAADLRIVLPAQTMANDATAPSSFLPMGSLYEGAQYLVFEYIVLLLRDRLGTAADAMRARHTNLE